MKIPIQFLIGLAAGFISYFAYDFTKAVEREVAVLQLEAKVSALLPLCPNLFKDVVKDKSVK